MNERIKELIAQAMVTVDHGSFVGTFFDKEKFAELIVRECMSLMNNRKEYYSKPVPYSESREYYDHMEDAFDDATSIIKSHFGVS